MFERKKIAAFIAGLLICAYAAAPAAGAFAEEENDDIPVSDDLNEAEDEDTDETYIKSGDFMYSMTHDDTICIEDCTSTSETLAVPDKIDGIAVTELGKKAFGSDPDNNTFTEITLPASIEYISDDNPFMYCTKLKKITVDGNNENFCTEDGILYTKEKDKLICYPTEKEGTSFKVPDSVKTLGTAALYDAELEEITLPDGLESIGFFAISCLPRLTSIDMSNTKVEEINPYAFSSCSTLSDVKFSEELTYIGGGAFSGCPILKEIKFPDALVEIGQYAFVNTGLTAAVIPDNVAEIGYCAFGYNTNTVGNIVADDSFTMVGKIGGAAYKYATDSDTEYDYKNNFTFLTPEEYQQELDYLNVERVKSGDFEYGISDEGTVLTCCYSSDDVITVPAEIDGHKITKIYPSCFGLTHASEIILPDTIEELREMAFYNCPDLKKITVPASVKVIGERAFDGCTSLEDVEFLGAETIGNRVFCNCSSLKNFKASGTVKEWKDEEPFIFCTALENIEIGSGDGIFCSENGIMYNKDKTVLAAYPAQKEGRSFTAPSSVTEVAQSAFANCHHLESVKLPNVRIINAYAFENCESLSYFDVSNKLEKLDSDALYCCTALKSLRLPESLTEIGSYAFGYYHDETADVENGEPDDVLVEGFTLYASKDSAAYKYAQNEGIKVVTGTTKFFGKSVSSGFVYTLAGILGAAVLGIIGVLTGKAVKKGKAEKAAAERKAKSAELRKKREEEAADEEEDESVEEDNE